MSLTYPWNWTWNTGGNTSSLRVREASSSLTSRALPSRGAYDIKKLASIHIETLSDIGKLFSQWNSIIQPVLDSLPAGGADRRWSLREEIDAHTYGIDGSTLFVSNDASSSVADGRYWHTSESRPITIAEALENNTGRISSLESTVAGLGTGSGSGTYDDTDLWDAVGWGYNPTGGTSASSSLDGRVGTTESRITHLGNDLWGTAHADPGGAWSWPNWSWSQSLYTYGVFEWVYGLMQLHGGVEFTGDPWDVNHTGITIPSHTHTQSEVGISTGTRTRIAGVSSSLAHDLQRLRYEISYTRGTAWDSGVINGPFVTNYPSAGNSEQTVSSHINFTGSGTATSSNPHALNYVDTGQEVVNTVIRTFTGMSSNSDSTPTYSTHITPTALSAISDGDSVEKAIALLDEAVSTASAGSVTRYEYYYDRTSTPINVREVTPINVSRPGGAPSRFPLVEVIDLSPESQDPYGQYTSLTMDMNVNHIDVNNLQIWTAAAYVLVILIY
jgi:hypothetical protein